MIDIAKSDLQVFLNLQTYKDTNVKLDENYIS